MIITAPQLFPLLFSYLNQAQLDRYEFEIKMKQKRTFLDSLIAYRRRAENKFFWLLLPLVYLIFLPAFANHNMVKDVMIYVGLIWVIMAGVFTLSKTKTLFYRTTIFAGITIALNSIPIPFHPEIVFLFRMFFLILFFGWLLFFVFKSMAKTRRIYGDIIFGAVDGYLLLGILGGFAFRVIHFFYPYSFEVPELLENKIDVFTYFSFVTLTNLGYGDITPIRPPSQSMALFLAVAGQMYLAIVIGILVGKFILFRKK